MHFHIRYAAINSLKNEFRFFSTSASSASFQSAGKAAHADVVIVGGGIVGLSTACALAQSSLFASSRKKILLIDAEHIFNLTHSSPQTSTYSNRVSSLTPSSVAFLENIGAWKMVQVHNRAWPYHHMKVWDAVGEGMIDFDHDLTAPSIPSSKDQHNPIATIVENNLVQSSLAQLAASLDNVEIFDCSKVQGIREVQLGKGIESGNSKPCLTLESGLEITCDLLIGADGINSKAREYAKIETVGFDYNQWGLVGTVELDTSSFADNRTAFQRFLPSGPIALLPLSNTHSSIVWSLKGTNLAHQVAKLDSSSFVSLLNAALHNPYKDIQFLLSSVQSSDCTVDITAEAAWGRDRAGRSLTSTDSVPWVSSVAENSLAPFPLRMRHAKQYTGNRVVLIGDAGHSLHPLAGQGLNLGLLDADELVKNILFSIKTGQDIADPNALSAFAASRYAHNAVMLSACHFIHHLFGNDSDFFSKARSLGLDLINQSPLIKSLFVKIAS